MPDGNRIDVITLVSALSVFQRKTTSADAMAIIHALMRLRRVSCLPPAYVDGIQEELLQFIAQPVPKEAITSVYLAFHGMDDRAAFMKVGVANSVKKRMRELYTGNPMPRMWTFSLEVPARQTAYRIEAAIHGYLSGSRTSGEWFQVHGMTENAVDAFVESLGEIAEEIASSPVRFSRIEV